MDRKTGKIIGLVSIVIGISLIVLDNKWGAFFITFGIAGFILFGRGEDFSIRKEILKNAAILYFLGATLILLGWVTHPIILFIGIGIVAITAICQFVKWITSPIVFEIHNLETPKDDDEEIER